MEYCLFIPLFHSDFTDAALGMSILQCHYFDLTQGGAAESPTKNKMLKNRYDLLAEVGMLT